MLSPDILQISNNSSKLTECDVFYLLKKDLQRRTTLSRVLTADKKNVCKIWMNWIHQETEIENTIITEVYMNCIISYLIKVVKNYFVTNM